MSDQMASALEATIEWDEAENQTFDDIRLNHPRKLAKYMEGRIDQFNAYLAKTAAEFGVDAEELRKALIDHKLDAATVGHVNGVAMVGFGARFR
jgi:hypothetical protein